MGARRIVTIGGTRPEAIKLAPLARLLDHHLAIDHHLVATGQHPTFHECLGYFGVDAARDLAVPNDGGDAFLRALGDAVPRLLDELAPDLVLVQGDTNSAWIAARAAAAQGVPVGHVEAGLRSGDPNLPWPEERNRREIDALATLLFAPSEDAAANCAGLPGTVHVTGNTGIDALLELRDTAPFTLHEDARRLILVTCHRGEAHAHLDRLAEALIRIASRGDVELVLPVHGNRRFADPLRDLLADQPGITLIPPLAYPELIALMSQAYLLLTDSGGLQEEAPALGLPTLVLRDRTERPEVVAAGNARLVGLDPDRIVRETCRLLDDRAARAAMAVPAFPYGRGDAAPRIVRAISDWMDLEPWVPPIAARPSSASYA